jgi:methyl-accepting chemotaxis protein
MSGLAEQTGAIAIEASRAGGSGDRFAEIAAGVDQLAKELRARSVQVDEVLRDMQADPVLTVA